MGDGAADYDLLTEMFLQQRVPTELCNCSCAYPSEGPSTDRCVLVDRKCKENCYTFNWTCFFPSIHPSTSLRLYVVSSVKWADGELMLLFAAIFQVRDLGIIIHRSLKLLFLCAAAAKKANKILDISRKGTENKTDINILPWYKALVKPGFSAVCSSSLCISRKV